jgi:hypothetical protein
MRRIINSTFITIDGVIQHPENWPYEDVEEVRKRCRSNCFVPVMRF